MGLNVGVLSADPVRTATQTSARWGCDMGGGLNEHHGGHNRPTSPHWQRKNEMMLAGFARVKLGIEPGARKGVNRKARIKLLYGRNIAILTTTPTSRFWCNRFAWLLNP